MTLKINGATGGSVSIDAPDNTSPAGTDVTLTLPTTAGSSGQYLQTNGTGTLSWQTVEGLPDAIDVNASAPADSVNIDSSGRLLVGTSSARSADFVTASFQIEGTNQNTSSIQLTCNSAASPGTTAALNFSRTRGSAVGATNAIGNGDNLGIINFTGADDTDLNSVAAQIRGIADNSVGSNDMPGRLAFYTTADGASSPTERMRITNNGSFCIMSSDTTMNTFGTIFTPASNTSTQPAVLNFSKTHSGTIDAVVFRYNGSRVGSIRFGDSATIYSTSSDYRLKENVVNLDGAIDRVKQLAPKRFNFIVDPDKTVDGFIAHEAQTVVPEAVTGVKDEVAVWQENETLPDGVSVGDNKLDEDGNTIPLPQGIDQSKLVPLLTAALQEAIGKIEALETANASLEARLTALEGGAA